MKQWAEECVRPVGSLHRAVDVPHECESLVYLPRRSDENEEQRSDPRIRGGIISLVRPHFLLYYAYHLALAFPFNILILRSFFRSCIPLLKRRAKVPCCLGNCVSCYLPTRCSSTSENEKRDQPHHCSRPHQAMVNNCSRSNRQAQARFSPGLRRGPEPSYPAGESQADGTKSPSRRWYPKRSLTESEVWELRLDQLGLEIDETIRFVERWGNEIEAGQETEEVKASPTQSNDELLRHLEHRSSTKRNSGEETEGEHGEGQVEQSLRASMAIVKVKGESGVQE